MGKIHRPNSVAIVLAGGTAALSAATAVAILVPSTSFHSPRQMSSAHPTNAAATGVASSLPPTASTSPTSPPTSSSTSSPNAPRAGGARAVPKKVAVPPAKTPASVAVAASSITYTVRAGDTLTAIAHWFQLHGYGSLYAANRAVIGNNPNLIQPGERIVLGTNAVVFLPPSQ